MKNALWLLALSATLAGCNGESSTDTDDTNDTTDTDTSEDTDVAVDNDTIDKAQALEWADGVIVHQDAVEVADDNDFFAIDVVEGSWYYVLSTRVNQANDGGEPDTVLTIYDDTQTQIAEIDDMPDRQYDTDSAIVFRATSTGTYIVQVQEWTQWDASSAGQGAPGWEYYLAVVDAGAVSEAHEDNAAEGTDNDSVEDAIASKDADGNFTSAYRDLWSQLGEQLHGLTDPNENGFHIQNAGAIEPAGDVDVLGRSFAGTDTDPFEPLICNWSLYPGMPSDLTPKFSLLDEDGETVALATAPFNGPYSAELGTGSYFDLHEPGGITFPILNEADLFLAIEDAGGAGGLGYSYMIDHWSCYFAVIPGTSPDPDITLFAIESETNSASYEDATVMNLTTDLSTNDNFYGNIVGAFETTDDLDSFKIPGNASTGQKISVMVQGSYRGSSASEITLSLLDSAGNELGTAEMDTDGIAEIKELPLTVGAPLYITVEDATGNTGPGAYYLGYVVVED